MSNGLQRYLSTAPVLAILTLFVLAGALIEFNRFFPDLLFHP
jgi:photosystem I subunit IX